MEYTQEELLELINGLEPVILEQEPVYAGHRPIKREYTLHDGSRVIEELSYEHDRRNAAWGVIKQITLTQIHNG